MFNISEASTAKSLESTLDQLQDTILSGEQIKWALDLNDLNQSDAKAVYERLKVEKVTSKSDNSAKWQLVNYLSSFFWPSQTNSKLKEMFPRGIHFHSGQLEVLSVAKRSGYPMIFIPCDTARQHFVDSIILAKVLECSDIDRNLILAQEELQNASSLENSIKNISMIFQLLPDTVSDLNWAVQHTMLTHFLQNGQNLVINTSNTDKGQNLIVDVCSHLVEIVDGSVVSDVLIVPVSTSYDKPLKFFEKFDESQVMLKFDRKINE